MLRALLFAALLLSGPAFGQDSFLAPIIPVPAPVNQGGTGTTPGGTALEHILAPGSNGILERTGTATWTQDAVPLGVAKGGTASTSLATGQLIIGNGTSAPTGLAETDGNRAQGVSGAWSTVPLSGTAPSYPTIVTSFCGGGETVCTSGNQSCSTGSPCTWTLGTNTKWVLIMGCGAGGGGAPGTTNRGGGGAGPGFCNPSPYVFLAAQLSPSQTISVGTGGAAAANGGNTCFGAGATCGSTKASTNLLYWGGGQAGQATSVANPGSPYGNGSNLASSLALGLYTASNEPSTPGLAPILSSAGANGQAALYGAPGGASGGNGSGNGGGNSGIGTGCATRGSGGAGGTTGTAGSGTTGTLFSTVLFLPGCSGAAGGGGTSGVGGTGAAGVGFAVGGGGGGAKQRPVLKEPAGLVAMALY